MIDAQKYKEILCCMGPIRVSYDYIFNRIQKIRTMYLSPTINIEEDSHTCDLDNTHIWFIRLIFGCIW